jgi:hypothetical protein
MVDLLEVVGEGGEVQFAGRGGDASPSLST